MQEKIEGKDVEEELREANCRADRATSIMRDLKANCKYLQELFRGEMHDEWKGEPNRDVKEERNGMKRMVNILVDMILAQIHNLEKYTRDIIIPRNEKELTDLIFSMEFEETIEGWSEEVRRVARETHIEVSQKLKYLRQVMYATDQKKTTNLLAKDQAPQCQIEHEIIKNFFDNRWKKGEPIDENLAKSLYKLDRRER
jgi:hypothetical protein